MSREDLDATARALVAPGKGILAADESHATIENTAELEQAGGRSAGGRRP